MHGVLEVHVVLALDLAHDGPRLAALPVAVLERQHVDTDYCLVRGSWDPVDAWGSYGGRVYSAALLAMTLEAPWRYERVQAER